MNREMNQSISQVQNKFADDCAQRRPEVHAAVDRISHLVACLGDMSGNYSERLQSVLRESATGASNAQLKDIPTGAALAISINAIADTLEVHLSAFGAYLDRLEV